MNDHLNQLRESIEKGLTELNLPEEPSKLYEPIRYTLALGGKRIRPIMALLGCELMGQPAEKAIHQALAIEIFHNFTLVHDDIMDDAEVRRKLPTVHKKWDPNVALLSGDGMIILAYQELFKAESEILSDLQDVFSSVAMEVCEGQQMDMDFAERSDVTIEEYLEMIRLKTAVLLGSAMRLGAIVGGASTAQLNAIKAFSESMGIVFQIRDDYLDAFGTQAEFGKQIGGDIKEGKRTWLYLKALEQCASSEERDSLESAMQNANLDQRIKDVMAIFERLQIRQLAEDEMNRRSKETFEFLERIDGNAQTKDLLASLVHYLLGRTT